MAYLTKLNNPFDLLDKETHTIGSGVAVFYYLNTEESDIEFVVSINGEIIEDYTYVIKDEDHLAFVAIPKGGGGGSKNVLRTVAMIAVAIAAPYAAPMVLGAMGVAATSLTLAVASTALVAAGGMIINSLLPVPQPSLGTSSSLENVSPTYSFSGGSNATASGTVLPIMLGEARVTPPIIGSYISLDGDKQYLNLLMAVNDGLVDDITDIEINGQPIDNFNDVTYSKTLGSNTQGVVGDFRDSHTTVSLQRGLDEQGIQTTYTTQGNSVQELEVVMLFPQGLYYIDDNGNYQRRSVEFEIAYKNVNESEWNYITREVIDYDYIYSDGSTEYTYDTYQGQYVRVDDDYGWYKNLTYSRKVVVSTTTVNTQLVSNVFKTTKRLAYTIKELPKGQYDIRVTRVSSYDTNTRVANSLTLDYVNEVVYDDFTYPGVALLSVNAMATDQLNGGMPTVTCKCTNIGADKKKNNPAWACYDLLKREGIDDVNIDLVKFQEWADYCDSKNLKCGLYLDSQQELQSALNMVSLLGRATVVQFGSTFAPIIDKVVDIPTQSFLFTSGNIIESSFSLDYIPYDDRSNVVEVTYYDEDDGYKAKIVQVQSHDYDTTTAEKKSSISLYGCTNQQQAANYAQFLLNNNRYITETVSFTASIDAIACSVGDVIKVGKKYMTNTIADGRIVSATDTTITLDQEVFLTAGESYELQIRLQDDAIITVDVPAVSSDTLTDTLTVNTLATIPQQFDVFAFGLQTLEAVNLYRVVNITRDSDLTRKIKAIEYNPDVYNDSAVINVESVLVIDDISNLAAVESLVKNADGSVDEVLTLNWVGTSSENAVYVNGSYHGTAYSNEYLFKNELVQNEQYVFKVGNSEISHKFFGKSAPPDDVSSFLYESGKSGDKLTWQHNDDIDLKGYKIKYSYGVSDDWNNAIDLFDGYITENFYNGKFPNIKGSYTFMIKAIDTSLNYSLNTNRIIMNIADPKIDNLIETYDFSSFAGAKINCDVVDGNLVATATNALMYDINDTDMFYDKADSDVFYDGQYEIMSYVDSFVAQSTGTAIVNYTGSEDAKFYYKKQYDSLLYNNNDLMYYKDDTDLMFTEENEYTNYIDGFGVEYGDDILIKLDFPQTSSQTSVSEFKIIVDAEDIYENINDMTIAQGGTTYTSNSIDIIKNVQATLQGGSGVNFTYTKDSNSITINVLDSSGNDVGGLCDLVLTGYKI